MTAPAVKCPRCGVPVPRDKVTLANRCNDAKCPLNEPRGASISPSQASSTLALIVTGAIIVVAAMPYIAGFAMILE